MQKIIEQDLSGSLEEAKKKAQYTWKKDEIAWIFDSVFRDVFKVQFTGEHWLVGSKWSRRKIYQFTYLESSGEHFRKLTGENKHIRISHSGENEFYSTKKEALNAGYLYIAEVREEAIEQFKKDSERLLEYAKQP